MGAFVSDPANVSTLMPGHPFPRRGLALRLGRRKSARFETRLERLSRDEAYECSSDDAATANETADNSNTCWIASSRVTIKMSER